MTLSLPPIFPTPPAEGWFLFDGGCGLCSRGVVRWAELLRRAGLEQLPIQTDWVTTYLGLDPAEPPNDVRVLMATGVTYAGAEAYRYILTQIGWLRPLALLSRLPIARAIFDTTYRIVARHRRKISRVCRLTPLLPPNDAGR